MRKTGTQKKMQIFSTTTIFFLAQFFFPKIIKSISSNCDSTNGMTHTNTPVSSSNSVSVYLAPFTAEEL